MKINIGLLNWGVFLIVLGAVPLAVEWGYLDTQLARSLIRLWPLILIGLGIGLILRFTPLAALGGIAVAVILGLLGGSLLAGGVAGLPASGCIGDRPGGGLTLTRDGAFATTGRADIELTCADVEITDQPGNAWRVETVSVANAEPAIEASADLLRLRSHGGDLFPASGQREWRISLPRDATSALDLTVNATQGQVALAAALARISATLNASDLRLDLTSATLTGSLSATLNASSSTLVLPPTGVAGGASISLNAASLTLCVDPALGLDIGVSETLSSNNFAAAGLSKLGERWRVDGTGGSVMTLSYSGNVSSITLDRDGGCQ